MRPTQNRSRGFTLIELVITVVVLAILAGAGIPSFMSFLKNIEVKAASESIFQGLTLARAEAVRRNERVWIIIGSDTAWTLNSASSNTALQSKPAKEAATKVALIFTPSNATRITFNSFGRVTANADGSALMTQIVFSDTGKTISRQITIDPGGRVNLCDPTITTAGDPRGCA